MNHALPRLSMAPLLLLSLLLGGAAGTFAQGAPNLIVNGSFEAAGEPSLAGWEPGLPDLASIVSPGSPGGGDWALQLEADQAPTLGFVTQKIEGLRDGAIIELQADVKASGPSGGGGIMLFVGDSPSGAPEKSAASTLETWTTLSLVDTLSLTGSDSVWVRLSSFDTEVVPRVGLFDSVSLTVLNPAPVVPVTWGALKARYR